MDLVVPLGGRPQAPPERTELAWQADVESRFAACRGSWRARLAPFELRAAGAGGRRGPRAGGADRLDPRQPRQRRHPAGLALLRALVDPRRLAHLHGAAAHRAPAGRARVHRLVRAVPVRQRQGAVLRRPARLRPGARARLATASSSTSWPSTTGTPATAPWSSASGPRWPRPRAYLDSLRAVAAHARSGARSAGRSSSGCCRPRSATRATRPSRCTRTGTTCSPCAGFKDAVYLAQVLGRPDDARRLAAIRDEFQRDLAASVRAAMARHGIDYVPGCADLGDFDATSTTIALDPAQAEDALPPGALERTFERYWEFFRDRATGAKPWENYTPYEMRTIGAVARLGWRERADSLLTCFLADRNPPGLAAVGRDRLARPTRSRASSATCRTPGWARTSCARCSTCSPTSASADSSLVLAAGVPRPGSRSRGSRLRGLSTPYGPLGYTLPQVAAAATSRRASRPACACPRGASCCAPPGSFRRATVDGVARRRSGPRARSCCARCPRRWCSGAEPRGSARAPSRQGHLDRVLAAVAEGGDEVRALRPAVHPHRRARRAGAHR